MHERDFGLDTDNQAGCVPADLPEAQIKHTGKGYQRGVLHIPEWQPTVTQQKRFRPQKAMLRFENLVRLYYGGHSTMKSASTLAWRHFSSWRGAHLLPRQTPARHQLLFKVGA